MFITDVKNFDGYKIHRNGFVISFKYKKPRILKSRVSKHGNGYEYVNLMKDGKYHTVFVHLLVAQHFMKDYDPSLQVNHIDGVKTHNKLTNLEMVTQSQNLKHAIQHGLMPAPPRHEAHWSAKLNWEKVREIRRLYSTGNYSQSELAKKFGVIQRQIYNIVTLRNWVEA